MKFFLIQKLNKNQLMSNIKMNTRRTTMLLNSKSTATAGALKKEKEDTQTTNLLSGGIKTSGH